MCDLFIFNKQNPIFYEFYAALDSKMKELARKGVGTIRKTADPITECDEQQLWNSGVINTKSVIGLSYGGFFITANCSECAQVTSTEVCTLNNTSS